MHKHHALLKEIRRVQTEINWLMPYKDVGLVPNPGARLEAIARAERRVGRPLPPSYVSFLLDHDGWPRFFEGASLLGTAHLGQRTYEELAQAACEAAETPVPDMGPPSQKRQISQSLITFGIDSAATALFAFNPRVVDVRGEYEVIAWINEIGVRRDNFIDFLELVLDLSEAELPMAEAAALKSA